MADGQAYSKCSKPCTIYPFSILNALSKVSRLASIVFLFLIEDNGCKNLFQVSSFVANGFAESLMTSAMSTADV